ncbi:MAG: prepilin-type cleavage/methylation domain-containing protein [Armatimonadetes bacterium]|nr:prepilin-type cleavage/methylation domain-containing protein [Armatimonadota bacterium]
MTERRAKRGFALQGLLVVVATMAMLAALLFPVLTMAREQAQPGLCAGGSMMTRSF